MRVLGLSGSLRRGSLNTALLRAAAGLAPEGMTIEIGCLSGLPLFDEDVEKSAYPKAARALREHIRGSDAVLIATPEYNFSVPGVLKNALDWVSRPLADPVMAGKPVGIMGAGGRLGTARAQAHLRDICRALGSVAVPMPEVFVVRAWEAFGPEGGLTDIGTQAAIRALLEAMMRLVPAS